MTAENEYLGMLDDIDNDGVGLTDWEIEFLDSMLSKPLGERLSERQMKLIERIHKERVKT